MNVLRSTGLLRCCFHSESSVLRRAVVAPRHPGCCGWVGAGERGQLGLGLVGVVGVRGCLVNVSVGAGGGGAGRGW